MTFGPEQRSFKSGTLRRPSRTKSSSPTDQTGWISSVGDLVSRRVFLLWLGQGNFQYSRLFRVVMLGHDSGVDAAVIATPSGGVPSPAARVTPARSSGSHRNIRVKLPTVGGIDSALLRFWAWEPVRKHQLHISSRMRPFPGHPQLPRHGLFDGKHDLLGQVRHELSPA